MFCVIDACYGNEWKFDDGTNTDNTTCNKQLSGANTTLGIFFNASAALKII